MGTAPVFPDSFDRAPDSPGGERELSPFLWHNVWPELTSVCLSTKRGQNLMRTR